MNPLEELTKKVAEIEKRIDYVFKDKSLLILSFVHRSFVNEYKKIISQHNERLEFLGDAVLSLIVSDSLFKTYPKAPEGVLSSLKSAIVDSRSCFKYLEKLNLSKYLLLGKGEKKGGSKRILANAFEALLGAVYLDGGFLKAKKFFIGTFQDDMDLIVKSFSYDFKSQLQEFCQRKFKEIPVYRLVKEEGLEHLKTFYVEVLIGGKREGYANGASKQKAEQKAAEAALLKIRG